MRCRTTCLALAAAVAASFAHPMLAGPPDGSKIPAKADWVCHIDVAAIVKSTVGKYIIENADDLDIDMSELEAIEDELGVDPLKLILETTIYGNDEEHVVALVRTTSELDEVIRNIEAQEDSPLVRVKQGDAEIFSIDGGEFLFHIIPTTDNTRLLVLAEDADVLREGIVAAYGKGETAGDAKAIEPIDGGLIYLAATSLPFGEPGEDATSAILQHATGLSARLAEQGENIIIDLRMDTATSENAKHITAILQGLLGLAQLMTTDADDEDVKQIADFFDGVTISSSDTSVSCRIQESVELAIKALKSASEEM